jgi:hypothetical protein
MVCGSTKTDHPKRHIYDGRPLLVNDLLAHFIVTWVLNDGLTDVVASHYATL